DVVDPGLACQAAAGLVAPRPAVFNATTMVRRVAEALVTAAAHHRTDAAREQRSADDAGRGRRRRSEERAATAELRRLLLRAAIGLPIGRLAILSARL